jgi:hypothetical protein
VIRRLLSLFLILSMSISVVHGGSASLSWVAPTENADGSPLTDLAGYRVWYGSMSGHYDRVLDVGPTTRATISNLPPGQQFFFAATAYDTSGNESTYSNEVSKLIEADEPGEQDTTPPTVAITSPTDGSTVSRKGQVLITAEATDDVAIEVVEVYINGVLLCEDTLAPFTCLWQVPAAGGPGRFYTLEAFAIDHAGNGAISPPVVVKAQ